MLYALLLAVQVSGAGASESLVLSPARFTDLEQARAIDAEGSPSGRAILVDEVGGAARARVRIGPKGDLCAGLYRVRVVLGSRDGRAHWATVQTFPHWQWFAALVESRQPGPWTWQTTEHLLILSQPGETTLEIRSKGDRDFAIGQVTLQRTEPFWPKEMIADAAFFAALDRRMPGLEKTIAAAEARDYERACTELAAHFRTAKRDSSLGGTWASRVPPRTAKRASEAAQLLLEDKLKLSWQPESQAGYCTSEQHRIEPTVFSFATPQQWHALYENPGRRWYGWFLGAALRDLADAYRVTGDPRYARKAIELVARFADEWGPIPKTAYYEKQFPNRYYTRASFGLTPTAHGWTKSSGIRDGLVEAVWRTLQATGACPEITDRQRIEAVKLCLLLTRFVDQRIDQTNGVPASCCWLVGLGRWLPEFPELVGMSRLALFRAMSFLDDCHFPDGAYFELCYYRHQRYAEVGRQAAAQGLDTRAYFTKLRPTFDLNVSLTHPMGNFPWINDAGGGTVIDPPRLQTPAIAELGLKHYPADPVFRYLRSSGREGEPPAETSRNFPWCGFMVMRSGWQPSDLHLVFDGCRNTGSHNHQDQMNIVLAAYGSTLLCDNGYVGTGFSSLDRKFYINHPRGHNLLTVDDLCQTPDTPRGANLVGWRAWANAPRDNLWLSAAGCDYAETTYDRPYRDDAARPPRQFEGARQQRRVLFLKPSTGTPYWVLYDRVEPKNDSGEHTLQLLFHASPTASARVEDGGAGARITASSAGLAVLPRSDASWSARIVRGDAQPERCYWQGFVSGGYAKPLVPVDCAVFEHTGPLPCGAATVLYPYPKPSAPPLDVRLLRASRRGVPLGAAEACGVEVRSGDAVDVILAQAAPGAAAEFGPYAFDGRLAAARHSADGKLVSVIMIDGSSLSRGGVILVDTAGTRAHYVECAPGNAPRPGVRTAAGLAVLDFRDR